MDLNTVTSVERPARRGDLSAHAEGDAFLAGGTWLFSEPQRHLRRLIDLSGLGWPDLEAGPHGLTIAATCPVSALEGFKPPAEWLAGPLLAWCCRAFWASFKVRAVATVGGNICLGLPAGPMISLTAALDGMAVLWGADGGERRLPVAELVTGPQRTALGPGELLRQVELPAEALRRRAAWRRISLTPLGRSAALVIGTLGPDGSLQLTVTASTIRPLRVAVPAGLTAKALRESLADLLTPDLVFDDVHGHPDWRRAMTLRLAEDVRAELTGATPA